jgi:hypothetical protein
MCGEKVRCSLQMRAHRTARALHNIADRAAFLAVRVLGGVFPAQIQIH